MDCSLPGSSVHGIFQARVLEWGAISFSRGFSRPRNQTRVSRTVGRHLTVWATRIKEMSQNGHCCRAYMLWLATLKIDFANWSQEPGHLLFQLLFQWPILTNFDKLQIGEILGHCFISLVLRNFLMPQCGMSANTCSAFKHDQSRSVGEWMPRSHP